MTGNSDISLTHFLCFVFEGFEASFVDEHLAQCGSADVGPDLRSDRHPPCVAPQQQPDQKSRRKLVPGDEVPTSSLHERQPYHQDRERQVRSITRSTSH